ncbi:hypothetical protein QN216_08090 [Bifidobacterium fermentum]|uniref:LapA family protein n=2 Tax=Bifidobacterium fermentum TaxID=3059035 RepID=A0AB39UH62_9BIFI
MSATVWRAGMWHGRASVIADVSLFLERLEGCIMWDQILGTYLIATIIGILLFVLWWVFLYFFLSAVIRRGIDKSVLRDQTDELEEYHRNMLSLESQKVELLKYQRQQDRSAPQETMSYPPIQQTN